MTFFPAFDSGFPSQSP